MEISSYSLLALAALLGLAGGMLYGSRKITGIVLFGLTGCISVISSCLFWASKVIAESDSAMAGVISEPLVLFSSKSRQNHSILQIGDSKSTFETMGKGTPLFRFGADDLVVERMQDGRVTVSTTIRDEGGKIIAELHRNDWKVRPSLLWDRNYNSHGLEVKNETGEVILQVRATRDTIRLQGIWNLGNGDFVELVKDPHSESGLLIRGPSSKIPIQPIFRYPSSEHLGELVSN